MSREDILRRLENSARTSGRSPPTATAATVVPSIASATPPPALTTSLDVSMPDQASLLRPEDQDSSQISSTKEPAVPVAPTTATGTATTISDESNFASVAAGKAAQAVAGTQPAAVPQVASSTPQVPVPVGTGSRTLSDGRRLTVCPDEAAVASALVEETIGFAKAAVAEKGAFSLAVSGGYAASALRALPAAAKAAGVDFSKWHLFFCHDQLGTRPIQKDVEHQWLGSCAIPKEQVHAVPNLPPEGAAAQYTAEICGLPEEIISDSPEGLPAVDLMILDVDDDGRCAGLRPGCAEAEEAGSEKVVLPIEEPGVPNSLTLSVDFMCASRRVVLLAPSSSQAAAVSKALGGKADAKNPAGLVRARDTMWLCSTASVVVSDLA